MKPVLVLGLILAVSLLSACKHPQMPTSSVPKIDPKISQGGSADPLAGNNSRSGRGSGSDNVPTYGDGANGSGSDLSEVESVNADENGISQASRDSFEGRPMDTEIFSANTIYFDFDSASVRPSDAGNITTVADYLKSHADCALLIDGHCDERGTEEYNQALGERRALSAREAVAKEGIEAGRIRTRSWGEAQPAVEGTDDASYAANRRGVFILLLPKAE